MSDTDSTFNFLISMAYTQLFNLLCEKADDVYGGRLPIHVRCLIDEMANIGQIPNLEKLIANTKGDGKSGDEFWTKAETLLYCALIGYIHYEAPVEEQNFATLIEFINAMEVREDDEEFQNPVDIMFENLEKKNPKHFAVRQYKKYKLAAGVINYKRFLIQSYERQPMAA